jgi:hypothetical protein
MKAKIEVLELDKSDIISILSGYMSIGIYWSLVSWDDAEYEEAKQREYNEAESREDGSFDPDDICLEDVLSNMLLNGKSLIISDVEEEFEDQELTLEKLINGINLSIQANGISVDLDDWDAVDCDVIIQNAIFNDVVYG